MKQCSLYPLNTPTRRVVDLSGIWRFRIDTEGKGRESGWPSGLSNTVPMAVPSSYNDVFTDKAIRDHVGDVWYQTEFFVPDEWRDGRVELRFGSAPTAPQSGSTGRRPCRTMVAICPSALRSKVWPGGANPIVSLLPSTTSSATRPYPVD